MKRRRIAKAINLIIIAHGLLALVFALITVTWLVVARLAVPEGDVASQPLATILVIVGFAPLILVAVHRRGNLVTGRSTDRLRALYFIASGLALVAALIFFNGVAHDIALALGFHGRFGCHTIEAQGQSSYLLDESTLPWLLFLPSPALLAVLLWLRSRELH